MDFRFSEDEEAFRQEVRQWLRDEIPERWIELDPGIWEETEESWALARGFQRRLGEKGWLAPAFPREYGGLELSHMKRLVLAEELAYNRAPVSVEVEITVNWVAPSIMLFGSEQQKKDYVTRIARGETIFCIGYTTPKRTIGRSMEAGPRHWQNWDLRVLNAKASWDRRRCKLLKTGLRLSPQQNVRTEKL